MRKRLKSIIVVMDLLDVLELQSCVWEGTTLCLGFTAECILYFYCYILERINNFPPINRFLDIEINEDLSKRNHFIQVTARTGCPVDTKKVIVVSQKLNEKFYRLNKKVNRDLFT